MSNTPEPLSMRLAVPDSTFRLTPAERASIRPYFDVDALERLLAAVEPEFRPMILEDFQPVAPGAPATVLVKLGDPALQPLLDEVWATVWEHLGPDAIEKETADWPGRELARKRRQEREQRLRGQ